MKTRFFLFALLLAALASSAMAADPIIGTWKLDVSRSKFAPNGFKVPKEQSEVYREKGAGQIELTFKRIETDGSSTSLTIAFPAQGGAATCVDGCVDRKYNPRF